MRYVISLLGIGLSLWLGWISPAIASIHAYPEGGDRTMYRSLQTLRDNADQAWQVVVFRRIQQGRTESVHLRLVGFPDTAAFNHVDPLYILASDRTILAPDALPEPSPFPANVGEYDVLEFASKLQSNAPLQLILPTQEKATQLIIPPFVVKEWRQLIASDFDK